MTKPVIIQLIADYGVGDPAFGEVIQKLTFLDNRIRVHAMSVPAFSTVATGIWIAQFALVNAFPGLFVFSNTAPRIIIPGTKETVDGGRLVYTKLDDGAAVLAVNAGYCLSFIKDKISSLHLVNVPNVGSQFRSRDYYPDAVVAIADGDKRHIGAKIPVSSIPDAPINIIGFIDGYGNLKTTLRRSQNTIAVGKKVRITVNKVTKTGVVADEAYKVKDGDVSFAPGSTGGTDRFMEIWVRGGSAWEAFGKPKVEEVFQIKPVG
jgi:S-adenosylmethionine hydrolase